MEQGKFRKWLINKLGGQPSEQPPAAQPPGYAPPGYPPYPPHPAAYQWPGYPQAPQAPAPPPGPPPAQPQAPQPPASAEYFGPQSKTPPPAPSYPPQPVPPSGEDDDMRTMAIGADLARFKIPSSLLTLQIMDRSGRWFPWTTVGAGGVKVGRSSEKSSQLPELNSMASKHMKIGLEGDRLLVEDLGSANGVYLRLTRPVELQDGSRFRVGAHVIEFRRPEHVEAAEELITEDGEVFWSRDLAPAAYLQFIRPDGRPGIRYPITKPDATVLGRESRPGRPVDLALPGDEWASGQHAQVRRDGDHYWLEDLKSRNGTFVRLGERTEIEPGDVLLVGRVLFRAVDPSRMPPG